MVIRGPRKQPERGDKDTISQNVTQNRPPEEDDQVNELAHALSRAGMGPDELAPPINATRIMKGVDVLEEIRHKYAKDPILGKVIQKPKDFKNFEVTLDGLVYLKILCGGQTWRET
ncbi:hypothetical protein M378DRAFT_173684 [Amanita muscaria Koide BX008]|uniref:Uncharacterized protein n=1 Tax=Amanita muscaria (strain Koide BX008) TaxID=946122 RepID=A0A0C2SMX2_AMAMK|nr:hypothetical protein M378DRAFT_173684 [Amanita muscaria Koide BX008]